MKSTSSIILSGLTLLALVVSFLQTTVSYAEEAGAKKALRPNIIFILADDLGYGDLGCFGQKLIKTPHLDKMAKEGMKLTQFYSGSTVCAPSRCVLMTGKHVGHCRIRGNSRDPEIQALTKDTVTVAKMLSGAGYDTALIGKWGLGEPVGLAEGLPNKQGFDYFFGYLNQGHAHNYYPKFLWKNNKKFPLCNEVEVFRTYASGNAGYATKRIDYSHDLFMKDALRYVDKKRDKPFFLFLALTTPHSNNEGTRGTGNGQEVPDHGIYTYKDWPAQDKGQAAMITRMDFGIGELFAKLKAKNLDENTIVFFTSDNGPHDEGGHNIERFKPSGVLRGMKRDMYEGGVRVPTIVRWPGKIKPNSTSPQISYFGDIFQTAAAMAGGTSPKDLDSISILPTLLGKNDQQKQHSHLYWEFYERGSSQAVRKGKWKAVRKPMFKGKVELYDLESDISEESDVSSAFPDVVTEMTKLLDDSHTPSKLWKVPPPRKKKKPRVKTSSKK